MAYIVMAYISGTRNRRQNACKHVHTFVYGHVSTWVYTHACTHVHAHRWQKKLASQKSTCSFIPGPSQPQASLAPSQPQACVYTHACAHIYANVCAQHFSVRRCIHMSMNTSVHTSMQLLLTYVYTHVHAHVHAYVSTHMWKHMPVCFHLPFLPVCLSICARELAHMGVLTHTSARSHAFAERIEVSYGLMAYTVMAYSYGLYGHGLQSTSSMLRRAGFATTISSPKSSARCVCACARMDI